MFQDAATTPTKGAIDPLPPPAQLGVGPGIVGMGQLLAAFAVMGACVAVHLVGGFALLVRMERRVREAQSRSLLFGCALLFKLFVALMLLHTAQVALWALLYRAQLGWDFVKALYFSTITYATIGYGDVVPPEGNRVGAAIEGMSGVLLLGWSSAIVFAVVNRLFSAHRERAGAREA